MLKLHKVVKVKFELRTNVLGLSERCKAREPSGNRLNALRSGTFYQLRATAGGCMHSPNVDGQPVGQGEHSFIHGPWLQDLQEASPTFLTTSAQQCNSVSPEKEQGKSMFWAMLHQSILLCQDNHTVTHSSSHCHGAWMNEKWISMETRKQATFISFFAEMHS